MTNIGSCTKCWKNRVQVKKVSMDTLRITQVDMNLLDIIYLYFSNLKVRPREVKWLYQSHRDSNRDILSEPTSPNLKPRILYMIAHCFSSLGLFPKNLLSACLLLLCGSIAGTLNLACPMNGPLPLNPQPTSFCLILIIFTLNQNLKYPKRLKTKANFHTVIWNDVVH